MLSSETLVYNYLYANMVCDGEIDIVYVTKTSENVFLQMISDVLLDWDSDVTNIHSCAIDS